MIQFLAIRTIAIILGLSSMVVALFVFAIDLVSSLNNTDPTNDYLILGLIILIFGSGAVTMASPYLMSKRQFKKYFIPTCILLGSAYLIVFISSRGALNLYFELLLMVMAILYYALAYLGYKYPVEA
ncbi:hypothetical protein ACFOZY_06225 [Chungangia koreensis]|uniref:Uncharacterized protein n=1 Tax=Chungangia koreensis TaxID=752657 RepID=A0ABV8X6Y4_9LACT